MGHHYVPQRYLRQFEIKDRPGYVWQSARAGDDPKEVSIKKAAQSREFYDPDMEVQLDIGVERGGGDAIDTLIRGGSLDAEGRERLVLHVAVMMRRVPAFRRWARELFADSILPKRMAELRELVACYGPEHGSVSENLAEVDRLIKLYETELPPEIEGYIKNPLPTELIFGAIASMNLNVCMTQGPQHFVTSDNPVFITHNCGIGNPESEFFLPLSPTHLLHGFRGEPVRGIPRYSVPQLTVREINKRTAVLSERFVYSHAPIPWLRPLLAKGEQSDFVPEYRPRRI